MYYIVPCPEISIYVFNCYAVPSRLFVTGGLEILSEEGTTQGDPVAMPLYAICILPLLETVIRVVTEKNLFIKYVAFADDVTGAGNLDALKVWWDAIIHYGPFLGYYVNPSKSWLIIKPEIVEEAEKIFADTDIKITSEGRKHLGAVIGSLNFKNEYIDGLIDEWIEEIKKLSEIAKTEPHVAYSAYVYSMQHKYTFYMRTIPNISTNLIKLDEEIDNFIKTLLIYDFSENERYLFSLPVKFGGLGIKIPSREGDMQYMNSRLVTKSLTENVINQNAYSLVNVNEIRKIKDKIKLEKLEKVTILANDIKLLLNKDKKRILECISERGASSWLISLPLNKYDFSLSKQEFRDALYLRYGITPPKLPVTCICGASNNVNHALSCPNGGFIIIRHNEVRDITSDLLSNVCKDVEIEPNLQPLTGERFNKRCANIEDEARLDVSARGFWRRGSKAFIDVRIFNPLSKTSLSKPLKTSYKNNENEKKREYNERVLQIEHGTFTPLVFSTFGGVGYEGNRFLKHLTEKIAEKMDEDLSTVSNYIRTKYSFALLRTTLLCLRGSRSNKVIKNTNKLADIDVKIAVNEARLFDAVDFFFFSFLFFNFSFTNCKFYIMLVKIKIYFHYEKKI